MEQRHADLYSGPGLSRTRYHHDVGDGHGRCQWSKRQPRPAEHSLRGPCSV